MKVLTPPSKGEASHLTGKGDVTYPIKLKNIIRQVNPCACPLLRRNLLRLTLPPTNFQPTSTKTKKLPNSTLLNTILNHYELTLHHEKTILRSSIFIASQYFVF